MEDWKRYFMKLLRGGGVKRRVVRGKREYGREQDEEREISKREIKEVIKKMRDRKAARIDEIPSETWKYEGKKVEDWLWGFCNRVWKGRGWLEKWKEGIIVSVIKNEGGAKVKNYRRITLMPTVYKVYTNLGGEVKRKDRG